MPLSEFLRMARGKLESGQQPTDLSSRSEDDLVELVWENGQIVMQGQSNRVTRSSTLNNLPSNTSRVHDDAGVAHAPATNTRFGKFGGVDYTLNDMAPVVPSGDLDMSQDDEMAPWLTYPIDDTLARDYVSELLPELSGVTANGMSTGSSFISVDKKSSCEQTTIGNLRSTLKASFPASKDRLLCSWPPQHHQISDALGSGVSDINNNSTSNHLDVDIFGSPAQGRGRDNINGNGSTSMKMERQKIQPPANNSNFLNFSHFSRPATLFKANVPNSDGNPALVSSGVETVETKEKGSASSGCNPIKSTVVERFNSTTNNLEFHGSSDMLSIVDSREPVVQALKGKESRSPERTENLCEEASIKNDKPFTLSNTDNSTKGVPDGERTVEPMGASSSVGSGNSADRVSCEQTHNSKRKFRYIEESECRSDDVETESLDVKKPTPGRGSTGSKRSRAAEVHNLSERRRRDRINEKMRALQELIPNCNKADKASMLDEAIEYLKTLQLQVQIMSMGAGLCMPLMMFPPGMQQMHPAHIPHFPPMGVGMSPGPGMGYGMGMLDMNSGASRCPIFPVPPMQVANFPSPVSGMTNFQRIPGPNLPVFGHPGQGLAGSVPGAPLMVPLTGRPPATSAMGLSALRNRSNSEVPGTFPIMNARDPMTTMNAQSTCNAEAGSSNKEKSDKQQATNTVLDESAGVQENKQATDARANSAITSTTATDVSKEPAR